MHATILNSTAPQRAAQPPAQRRTRRPRTLLRWIAGLALVWLTAVANATVTAPQTVIENAFAALTLGLQRGEVHGAMSEQQLQQFIERELGPSIDFERFARGVMGKYARQADTTQLAAFSTHLKALLLKTYSKGLGAVERFERVEIIKALHSEADRRATVSTRLWLRGGASYQVSYQMVLGSNGWRISNVIAEGVNLGLVYRQQFADLYNAQGQNLDATLAQWEALLQSSS